MLAQLASQVLVFFVLLFSPITFPADQLPDWFQSLHALLPVQPAADLMRAGIASGTFSADGRDLLVLTIWTLVDRKSTRLNSSHVAISYAVFCLKKKR